MFRVSINSRITKDIEMGIRTEDVINRSISRLTLMLNNIPAV